MVATAQSIALNEAKLIASVCRESFEEFVKEFWHDVVPEELKWSWHMRVMCSEAQEVAERVFKGEEKEHDLIVNVPPGSTKSTILSIMFPAWIWTRMPSARILSLSYEYDLALNFSRKTRDLLQTEHYRSAFDPEGKLALKEDQNTKGFYENSEGGQRYARGTGGNITGFHGHFIIVDDPINPKSAKASSGAKIKEVNNWMDETLPTRKIDQKITVTILVMQRLHEDDPTGHMLAKKGLRVRHICLPGEETEDIKPPRMRYKYRDGLLDPLRHDRSVLNDLRAELGEYGYAGQVLQRPVPIGGGMFKWERIKIDVPSVAFVRKVRYWDKAGTEGDGTYTVGALLALDINKRYWVLDIIRGQWDSGKREQIIKQTAEADGATVTTVIEQEPGSGGKESAQATITNLAGQRVYKDRPVGDKVWRADTYSVQVNNGNVSIVKGASSEWWPPYRDEMKFFPFSTYKDQIDASSGAFAILSGRIKVGAWGR